MSSAPHPQHILRDPFLLPVCDCGGPMNLASLEPHPTQPDWELKTYKCATCGAQQVFAVEKRPVGPGVQDQPRS